MTKKEATQLQADIDIMAEAWGCWTTAARQAYQRVCRLTKKYGRKE